MLLHLSSILDRTLKECLLTNVLMQLKTLEEEATKTLDESAGSKTSVEEAGNANENTPLLK